MRQSSQFTHLTCPKCGQKTITNDNARGYICTTCSQSWMNLQEFIRTLDLKGNAQPTGTQPIDPEVTQTMRIDTGLDSSKSWWERLSSTLAELPVKFVTVLTKFLAKLLLRLVVLLLSIVWGMTLLVTITVPILIACHLYFKLSGRELSPDIQRIIYQNALPVVFAISIGLTFAIVAWRANWVSSGVIVSGLVGAIVGFLTWSLTYLGDKEKNSNDRDMSA